MLGEHRIGLLHSNGVACAIAAVGQPLPFASGFTDLETWSEVAEIPSVPRIDRCNGSWVPLAVLCGFMPGSAQSTQTIISVSPEKMVLAELRCYAAECRTEPMPQPEQADISVFAAAHASE